MFCWPETQQNTHLAETIGAKRNDRPLQLKRTSRHHHRIARILAVALMRGIVAHGAEGDGGLIGIEQSPLVRPQSSLFLGD